ncbi:Histidine kinase-, DNA gyrase B-, and HSP90-like ATPase [Pustulibacterium marinum]|uniref:histidine kinase n=1 Tax=Pustulibacterium marinum TaxID=1224947 RepID=A0A1I7EX03_9FLAO|nr:HAMP domain-containing sensor histidine kinase [Pustulibacterium marinum]SFU28409.1 Histidine kinase-, DNA gyrase B-, and HSP90-like ATPase [Pustulibacterium marinum]
MFFQKRNTIRWILIVSSFVIVSLILWNTYNFFQKFKDEERTKMEIWAAAQQTVINAPKSSEVDLMLPLKILESNKSTPMILMDVDGNLMYTQNMDDTKENDTIYINDKIDQFQYENQPIEVVDNGEKLAILYYGNSALLNKLKYYPLALLLIIFLFGTVVYFFYRTAKISDQNKLWAGMAKETAHQIGTPLSSLLGWTELLKTMEIDESITSEIEKDIDRLQTITERFSKIGSVPKLQELDIVAETHSAFDYLKARTSKLVEFSFEAPNKEITVLLNNQLFGWTIENLVKNAIDAMRGKGTLKLAIEDTEKEVKITVTDNGKGIHKQDYKNVFKPGFTTKKRGWGLGLSLVKRIIEDYHQGKVKVLHSEIGKGTTMQISLKKAV